MNLLDEDEELNPMLSVVNLVDVFLVVIAALLIAIAQNPTNPFTAENVTVITNPGEDDMRITVKRGEVIEEYQSTGEIGDGEGARAGIAYRMPDGSMIYVPDEDAASTSNNP
jgi:hypothetical protein